jgi:hypothetical protein
MKANIERGKLIAPKNLGAALSRRKLLDFELKRMTNQVNDPKRREMFPNTDAFLTWHTSAERAAKLFALELRLLSEWIDVRQNDTERLLREAYEALKVLEVEVDFDPHETALMERLDGFFDHKDEAEERKEKTCQVG